MTKAAAARRLASAAAYGGGGLSVLGAGLYGVLRAEATVARRAIGPLRTDPPPNGTGWYGRGRPGPAIRVALLGDSSAAGYGVERVQETPAALLATGVATAADGRVHLRAYCVVGARSSDLGLQVDRALAAAPHLPDVAVVLIGANDVTHVVRPSESVAFLAEAVTRLCDHGVAVVVGTCPDLGTIKPIAPPLKQVARAWSRRMAAAQTIAVVEAGGRTVSLGSILGPEFAAAPAVLFGPDQFHPSVLGYRSMAQVLLPSVLAALGLGMEEIDGAATRPGPPGTRGQVVLPITTAALEAVDVPGTEVDGTEVGGRRLGVRGRWVELRMRRRHPHTTPEVPETSDPTDPAGIGA